MNDNILLKKTYAEIESEAGINETKFRRRVSSFITRAKLEKDFAWVSEKELSDIRASNGFWYFPKKSGADSGSRVYTWKELRAILVTRAAATSQSNNSTSWGKVCARGVRMPPQVFERFVEAYRDNPLGLEAE